MRGGNPKKEVACKLQLRRYFSRQSGACNAIAWQDAHLGTFGRSRNSDANGVAIKVTTKLRQKRVGSTSVPGDTCIRQSAR